jgi:hypothetical protein
MPSPGVAVEYPSPSVDFTAAEPPSDGESRAKAEKSEDNMMRTASRAWRGFVLASAALSLATLVAAQTTQTKETVPGGPAKVKTVHVKGELVVAGSNWLIAKDHTGRYTVYGVKEGRKFIVDGTPKTLAELKPGTFLTATATTTETPMIKRTTTITQGTVFWASPTSIIVTSPEGENKQYAVPTGFKFDVDGQQIEAMQLRQGMKLSGTKIVEEPLTVITTNVIVTGTAPK